MIRIAQVMPVNPVTRRLWTANNYSANLTRARFELLFRAAHVPPLGSSSYSIRALQLPRRGTSI